MNVWDVIIIIAIIVLIVLALKLARGRKRTGGCGCECANCRACEMHKNEVKYKISNYVPSYRLKKVEIDGETTWDRQK